MKYDITNINKRIERIKDFGLVPITLKAPSNIIEKIVNQKGTSVEGLIMSFSEAQFTASSERNEQLTLDEYNKSLNIFMKYYESQTYMSGAIDQAYEDSKRILKWLNKEDKNPELYEQIYKMDKRSVVKMLIDVGEEIDNITDSTTSGYGSDGDFYRLAYQWIEDNKK